MRFHSLTITGLGPFRGSHSVDFDAVSSSGLFLIEGPTGSGKTTLIDAIVFALYGSLSGAESDAGRLRSHLCGPGEPTEVCLDFSISGVRHTVTRNPSYERPKERGTGTTQERARQTLVVHDDVTPDMREAREIGSYLLTRLGLNADQFRRLVVLPQGEFDALLRARPRERYDMLASLMDDGFLARVQEDLKREAESARRERDEAEQSVTRVAEAIALRAAEVCDVPEGADPLETISALSDGVHRAARELQDPLDRARAAALGARQQAADARQAMEARAAVLQAESRLDPADVGLDGSALQARAKDLAGEAARLRPLADWEAGAEERHREQRRLRTAADEQVAALESARTQAEAFPQRMRDVDDGIQAAEAAAGRAAELTRELTRLETLGAALVQSRAAATAVREAEGVRTATGQALQEARNRLNSARTHLHDLVRSQLDQRAAHLASLLTEGSPCPVCGATEHPDPASSGTGVLIHDDDVARAEAIVAAAEADEVRARADDEAATLSLSTREKALVALRAQTGDASETDVARLLLAAKTELDTASATAADLEPLRAQREALQAEAQDSATRLQRMAASAAAAHATADAFSQQLALETERHRERLGSDDGAAELLARAQARLESVEAALRARVAAAGKPIDADVEALETAAATAQDHLEDLSARFEEADRERVRVAEAVTALTALQQQLHSAHEALADIGARTEAAVRIGSLVTARSAANQRNLTLQAYAVQRRFHSVLSAGSRHLERMSSGRYSFALDETSSGGAQAGLGIDIVDSWSAQLRDPATLSGGETFYASLSLALGLADVVREEAGGVALDTLFVDEGFGSLDADTLGVVLDQLDALRARGRTVGVISHVAEMKEWVHDRIEVIPSSAPGVGSRIRQTGTR